MANIKTHTFNGEFTKIEYTDRIDGVTETTEPAETQTITILTGNDFRAFHSALHEALEASGFCDNCLHEGGDCRTWDPARFLWRWLGKRK
jgi:hypothetical protein